MTCFVMNSGQLINIRDISVDDIHLEDIAHHLSKIQRFNGGLPTNISYSVGEHCINLVRCVEAMGGVSTLGLRLLLLHDASEAYLSDIVGPVKPLIPDYVDLENYIQRMINKKFLGVTKTLDDMPKLKSFDKRILIDEVLAIKPHQSEMYKTITGLNELGCCIQYNNHSSTVKKCFLTLAKTLGVV